MNQRQLVNLVRVRTGLSRNQAAAALNTILDTIVQTVAEGDEVALENFGTFRPAEYAPHSAHNIATGKRFVTCAVVRMQFRVAPKVRQIVAAGDPTARRSKTFSRGPARP
ncbi:HU family DNA-binding protein [Streptomyces sp. NPDC096153]|uniref:HU family DNA-binding protein n=1 Tax=Streptomyces sp. NPDC096153 TaxID=3155548 RepID=UPI00332C338E